MTEVDVEILESITKTKTHLVKAKEAMSQIDTQLRKAEVASNNLKQFEGSFGTKKKGG